MSSTSLYADTFNAYTNSDNISNVLQNKVDNVAQNEVLFGSVDYSAGYNSILSDYNSSIGNLENGSNDEDVPGSDSQDAGNENGESGGTSSSAGSTELAQDGGTKATEEQVAQLRQAYEQIEDEQGWVGKAWNGIKNFFGHSNGSNAIEETLDKVEAGEISYEAAVEKLSTYQSKQESTVDTFANIASGLAVAAGVILAPVSFGASLAIGAGVGAAVKVGIKASDKATNDIQGDYSLKDGLKDGVTGGVGGLVTAATAGIGSAGVVAAKEGGKVLVKETIKQGVIAGAKAGAIDGAVMGATNYTADAVFDGDEFTFGGLVANTASGAATGAVAGGVVGGVTSGISAASASKGATGALAEIPDDLPDIKMGDIGENFVTTSKNLNSAIDDVVTTSKNLYSMTDNVDNLATESNILKVNEFDDLFDVSATTSKELTEEGLPNLTIDDVVDSNIVTKTGTSNVSAEVTQAKPVRNNNGKIAKTPSQRIQVLKRKVYNGEIKTLNDAYKAGFTTNELKSSNLYQKLNVADNNATAMSDNVVSDLYDVSTSTTPNTKLNNDAPSKGAADNSASAASQNTNSLVYYDYFTGANVIYDIDSLPNDSILKSFVDRMKNMFSSKGISSKFSVGQAKKLLTGKSNPTVYELKNSYLTLKNSKLYSTNLIFRTLVEDAFNIGCAQQ